MKDQCTGAGVRKTKQAKLRFWIGLPERNPSVNRAGVGRLAHSRFVLVLIHLQSQAERPHVGPGFLDMRQAFGPGTCRAGSSPAKRQFLFGRPDGVLLLMIYDNSVCSGVFYGVTIHVRPLSSCSLTSCFGEKFFGSVNSIEQSP